MKRIRNIEISQKADRNIQQGESCFKYVILAFVAACWLCKSDAGSEALASLEVHKFNVAAVGNLPVQDKSDPMGCGDHWPCVLGWHL
jgi:hypothetical protein